MICATKLLISRMVIVHRMDGFFGIQFDEGLEKAYHLLHTKKVKAGKPLQKVSFSSEPSRQSFG